MAAAQYDLTGLSYQRVRPRIRLADITRLSYGKLRAVSCCRDDVENGSPGPVYITTSKPIFLPNGIQHHSTERRPFVEGERPMKDAIPLNINGPDFCPEAKLAIKYVEKALAAQIAKEDIFAPVTTREALRQSTTWVPIHPRFEFSSYTVQPENECYEQTNKSFVNVAGLYYIGLQIWGIFAPLDSTNSSPSSWRMNFALRTLARVQEATEKPIGWGFATSHPSWQPVPSKKPKLAPSSQEALQGSTSQSGGEVKQTTTAEGLQPRGKTIASKPGCLTEEVRPKEKRKRKTASKNTTTESDGEPPMQATSVRNLVGTESPADIVQTEPEKKKRKRALTPAKRIASKEISRCEPASPEFSSTEEDEEKTEYCLSD